MTEIRSVADSVDKNVYYPQTHYQAIIGFEKGIRNIIQPSYLKDLHSIKESGLFYFDEKTINKPAQLTSGFIQAILSDEKNGLVQILSTLNFYDIKDGTWSKLQTSKTII
ncbi:MAG: hypothetical protein J6573_07520 [Lactobacillus sp.]|nr:hypothetical protein [Lactobacillus sp.]